MGLKVGGSRSPPYKAGVSSKWVTVLCIASFCFGVFVINRLLTVPGPVRTVDNAISGEHESQELHPVLKCEKKDNSLVAGDILSQVSKTHDVIMGLDKTIASLEMKLAAARAAKAENEEISTIDRKPVIEPLNNRPKVFLVMGIITAFSSRKRRDSIRETWMPQGEDLRKLEKEKGIIIRFVIGHSATPGGVLDRAIDAEDTQHNDFFRLNHVEGYHELSSKTQLYFSTAVANWDAEFFIKVDDDVHVNLGVVGSLLDRHRSKPRVYVGCMKSGPVLSQTGVKYHEPEYWKFGEEGNKYFRHATGQIYAISKDLATYISINGYTSCFINLSQCFCLLHIHLRYWSRVPFIHKELLIRHILHRYANEDVSLGSWFIGLDIEHIDERSLCCGTPPGKMLTHVYSNTLCGALVSGLFLLLLELIIVGIAWLKLKQVRHNWR